MLENLKECTLHNNIHLNIIPVDIVSGVMLTVWFRIGSRDEEKSNRGISHLYEHMVFQGNTNFKTYYNIMDELDSIGGSIDAKTHMEYIRFKLIIPEEQLERGINLLKSMLFESSFDDKILQKEKEIVANEINDYLAYQDVIIGLSVYEKLFIESSMANMISGKIRDVNRLTRRSLINFTDQFVADDILIQVIGDFKGYEVLTLLNRYFGNIKFEDKESVRLKRISENLKVNISTDNSKIKGECFSFGYRVTRNCVEEDLMFDIIHTHFCSSYNSILSNLLREEHHYLYDIRSRLDKYSDCYVWSFGGDVEENNLLNVINLVRDTISNYSISSEQLNILKKKVLQQYMYFDISKLEKVLGRNFVVGNNNMQKSSLKEMVDCIQVEDINDFIKKVTNLSSNTLVVIE